MARIMFIANRSNTPGTCLRPLLGSAIPEFASALTLFICCLLIPLADIAVVPIRYVLACGLASELAHRVALVERPSQVYTLLAEKSWFQNLARKCGVQFGKIQIMIVCHSNCSESYVVCDGEKIPQQWLPDGSKAPCSYLLQLNIETEIAPLFVGGPVIPGVTAPIKIGLI